MKKVRIGTRRSTLATAQARQVADALRSHWPDVPVELVPMSTAGDRRTGPLAPFGGKGAFTSELESALRDGRIDLAVHSAKDMPALMAEDLCIVAVPLREDPRDALVSVGGGSVDALRPGATVGTGSLRRRAQLLAVRSDLRIVPVRGNVQTRLNKALVRGEMDAVVLAMAGLKRSGLAEAHRDNLHPLPLEACTPAAGQGALAVQGRTSAREVHRLTAPVDDAPSRSALLAERSVLLALGADCHSCLAVHASPAPRGRWRMIAMVARPDGTDLVRLAARAGSAAEAAASLLAGIRDKGADKLLS